MSGAVKYCKYGSCRSDSRPRRPQYVPGDKFFRFPKPCLNFRKCGLSKFRGPPTGSPADFPPNYIKTHVKNCKECSICDQWMRKCKRDDAKFRSIADITKDWYICCKHFDPDVAQIDYEKHLPGVPAPKRRKLTVGPVIPHTNRPKTINGVTKEDSTSAESSLEASSGFSVNVEDLSVFIHPLDVIPHTSRPKTIDGDERTVTKADSTSAENSLEASSGSPISVEDPSVFVHPSDVVPHTTRPKTIGGDKPTVTKEDSTSAENSLEASSGPPINVEELSVFVHPSDLVFDGVITDPESFDIIETRTAITRSMETQTSFTGRSVESQTDITAFNDFLSENERLKNEITILKEENSQLVRKCKKKRPMNVFEESVRNGDALSIFYLGFTYSKLLLILKVLNIENISHYWNTNYEAKDKKMFTPIQEFMLTLLRLRGGLLLQDIGYRFDVSIGYVSGTTTTWIQALYQKFDALRPYMFPSREQIQEHLPKRFSNMKNIRVIIDGAEIFAEAPQNFEQQSNMYSHYKAHSTLKILLGCTPNGVISFVSDVFEGSISDRELVIRSNLMSLLDADDLILADRGFTIKDLADSKNVQLNIPAFLKGRDKLTPQEEVATKNIAKNRIFVEHMVRRLKEYRLFKRVIPLSMRHIVSQCVFVCACLVNFNSPLLNDDDDDKH